MGRSFKKVDLDLLLSMANSTWLFLRPGNKTTETIIACPRALTSNYIKYANDFFPEAGGATVNKHPALAGPGSSTGGGQEPRTEPFRAKKERQLLVQSTTQFI